MINVISSGLRNISSAYLHLHLLDIFLEGVSEQRKRIKQTIIKLQELEIKVFSSDGSKEDKDELFKQQQCLFREIHVFFSWWHSVYVIIWTGEKSRENGEMTDFLVKTLGAGFAQEIEVHRIKVESFSGVRNDLEHILDRIHTGEHNLGNLLTTGNNEHIFQFGSKRIDISFDCLDFVDLFSVSVNQWLISQQGFG